MFNTYVYILFVPGPPSSDFSRHSLVRPVVLHGRTKREIPTTRDTVSTFHK